ncbi:hypothetical protein AXG93_411s1280 [Marchantia polymorpha subsp. ruderalis]|uniref:Peroxisomal membrane protein 11C n=2 Tax=Marchantia polymorpha TaxID=3197 RepID=A0A176VH76_MARPO|nr:hypothetical protein AXG93_411s1280 [Marchantia polymorpha subsp. ruderalis]
MATTLDVTRIEIAFLAAYLSKAETRDKLCRAIQYGSKFVSNGEPGTAATVDKNTSLARKVFRLLKTVNELQALLTPAPKSTPLPIVLLGKSKNVLVGTFLALDQIVWLGRSGIYKDKEKTDRMSRISLFCWMAGTFCTTLVEMAEISRTSIAVKKVEKELRKATNDNLAVVDVQALKDERKSHYKKNKARTLNLVKSFLDLFVAAGLLQLAPKTITPRVTGALGLTTSLISCYQLLPPAPAKAKSSSKFGLRYVDPGAAAKSFGFPRL